MIKLPTKKFKKCLEDFICQNCGYKVKGNGFTNHCTQCLYSLHVDINPGDRSAHCAGLMEPIDYFAKNGQNIIVHKCQKCKFTRNNKVASNDNVDNFLKKITHKKIYYNYD